MSELPRGWARTTLDGCCEVIAGQSPPGETYNDVGEGPPFYQGKTDFTDLYPVPRKWCSAPTKVAEQGDVLISVRAPVGPTNLASETCCIGRGIAALRPREGIRTKFVLYGMRATEPELAAVATGSTFSAVSSQQLRQHALVVAPSNEQDRIIGEIEKQFSRLDAATAALKRLQANLKRYRASVLKAACEGRLVPTEAPGEYARAKVLSLLREPLANGRSPQTSNEGHKILRLTAIKNDAVDTREWRFGNLEDKQIANLSIRSDDILVSRGNGSKSLVGLAGLVGIAEDSSEPVLFPDTMIRVRLNKELCDPQFFVLLWNSRFVRDQIESAARTTAGIHKISQADIETFELPLPPIEDQLKIVDAAARVLTIADHTNSSLVRLVAQSARLRAAVLTKAFSGKLVSQDPADEPASVLLERIRAERVPSLKGAARGNGRRSNAVAAG